MGSRSQWKQSHRQRSSDVEFEWLAAQLPDEAEHWKGRAGELERVVWASDRVGSAAGGEGDRRYLAAKRAESLAAREHGESPDRATCSSSSLGDRECRRSSRRSEEAAASLLRPGLAGSPASKRRGAPEAKGSGAPRHPTKDRRIPQRHPRAAAFQRAVEAKGANPRADLSRSCRCVDPAQSCGRRRAGHDARES
jgi:hypothetical protein